LKYVDMYFTASEDAVPKIRD